MAPPSRSRPTSLWAGTAHRLDLACALADVRATRLSFHARNRTLSRYTRTRARTDTSSRAFLRWSMQTITCCTTKATPPSQRTHSSAQGCKPTIAVVTYCSPQPSQRTCAVSRTGALTGSCHSWTYPRVHRPSCTHKSHTFGALGGWGALTGTRSCVRTASFRARRRRHEVPCRWVELALRCTLTA